uniref:CCHC-type domain-containing protein n=1 Tax=Cajanus cajan TaxID=3821 RepID=A0A151UEW5_CAJCA
MEENESIKKCLEDSKQLQMLSFLGRSYDNFDHIDKLLRSLPKKWRPQVTALRASKNLKKLSLEELIGLLKVHELELQQDDAGRKQKSIALNVQKTKSTPDKAQPLCFECKKLDHYKIECPELENEKEKEKRKMNLHKKKKAMMATWEDLDVSSTKDDEEANICLMADVDSSSESDDDKVSKSNFKSLEHAYNQLLSDSTNISTAYREQKKKISELLEENLLLKNENAKLLKESKKGLEEAKLLNKENESLKSYLSKFTLGTKNLEQLLKYCRSGNDKLGLGYVESESENKSSTSAYPTYGKHGRCDTLTTPTHKV